MDSHDDADAAFIACKSRIRKKLKRSKKKTTQRQQTLEEQLQTAQGWERLHHEALLLQSNLYRIKKGMATVEVLDWERDNQAILLPLDTLVEPVQQIDKLFKKSRKLKKGLKYIEKALEEVQAQLIFLEQALEQLEAVETLEELNAHFHSYFPVQRPTSSPAAKRAAATYYREYRTAAGLSLFVGKSAQDNERVTFTLAHGSDWWFHVADFPGAHVVLRVSKNQEPDMESVADALQLALAYSKAKKQGEAIVYFTQRKHVARLGKRKGQVHMAQHREQKVHFDPLRFEALKKRPNPLL